MKTKILFVVSLIILLASCQKEDDLGFFDIGIEKKFQAHNEYLSNDQSLKFTITEINDSRCPSDIVCVWQGEAVVNIEVKSPQSGVIALSTYDNLKDTVGNYSFELIRVAPYPISTETIELEDYEVSLKIVKL